MSFLQQYLQQYLTSIGKSDPMTLHWSMSEQGVLIIEFVNTKQRIGLSMGKEPSWYCICITEDNAQMEQIPDELSQLIYQQLRDRQCQ